MLAMDGKMHKMATTPLLWLASRAHKFLKDGEIWWKVCGDLSMDSTMSFEANAKNFGN